MIIAQGSNRTEIQAEGEVRLITSIIAMNVGEKVPAFR